MPTKCCVPNCKGNYPTGPKVSVFTFPVCPDLRRKWLSAIQRKDFVPNKNSRVCELHFIATDFEHESSAFDDKTGMILSAPLSKKRKKKNAVPSVFNYPSTSQAISTPPRLSPNSKKTMRESKNLKTAMEKSVADSVLYDEQRSISCLEDLQKCVNTFGIDHFYQVSTQNEPFCAFHLDFVPYPNISHSVTVSSDLNISIYFKNVMLQKLSKYIFPHKLSSFNELTNILEELKCVEFNSGDHFYKNDLISNVLSSMKTEDNDAMITFLEEQLSISNYVKNNIKYSSDLIIFSTLLHSISPHAYKYIRSSGKLILPHPSTLRKVCQRLSVAPDLELTKHFLMYINSRAKYIPDKDKIVILLLDEIHIKPYFDYKGGSVVGMGYDADEAAKSAFVFMISSLMSSFKEVVHILPVSKIDHILLHNIILKVILGLENINFTVIAVVTDNNAINRKAMSLFTSPHKNLYVYPHPRCPSRPLFFIIDSVHLFKNIRNNWLNQRNDGKCFFYPNFDASVEKFCTASFASLRQLYDIDSANVVSYARGLTWKSLRPSNLERQNVKLVLKVFNKFVCEALDILGPDQNIPHFTETADFIRIIVKWWEIMNVKCPFKGSNQRNVFMTPMRVENDEKVVFLENFLIWLENWKLMKCTTGGLSKETHEALTQTTTAILDLTKYCVEELAFDYILPGKVQTDDLEDRFGKYRQLAGAHYNVTLRQVLECEKKLRIQSLASADIPLRSGIFTLESNEEFSIVSLDCEVKNICILDKDIKEATKYLKVIMYLAGYCSHSLVKKFKCSECKEHLTVEKELHLNDDTFILIRNLDKGGLLCPTPIVVNYVLYTYIITEKLKNDADFMLCKEHRKVLVNTAFTVLDEFEILENSYECSNGHREIDIAKQILWISSNILLKNLCMNKNDLVAKRRENNEKCAKRKLKCFDQVK